MALREADWCSDRGSVPGAAAAANTAVLSTCRHGRCGHGRCGHGRRPPSCQRIRSRPDSWAAMQCQRSARGGRGRCRTRDPPFTGLSQKRMLSQSPKVSGSHQLWTRGPGRAGEGQAHSPSEREAESRLHGASGPSTLGVCSGEAERPPGFDGPDALSPALPMFLRPGKLWGPLRVRASVPMLAHRVLFSLLPIGPRPSPAPAQAPSRENQSPTALQRQAGCVAVLEAASPHTGGGRDIFKGQNKEAVALALFAQLRGSQGSGFLCEKKPSQARPRSQTNTVSGGARSSCVLRSRAEKPGSQASRAQLTCISPFHSILTEAACLLMLEREKRPIHADQGSSLQPGYVSCPGSDPTASGVRTTLNHQPPAGLALVFDTFPFAVGLGSLLPRKAGRPESPQCRPRGLLLASTWEARARSNPTAPS